MTRLVWVNSALVVIAGVALLVQQSRIGQLEARLDEVAASVAERPARPRMGGPRARPASQPLVTAARAGGPPSYDVGSAAAEVEEQLWSEGGREAIADVVAEREEEEREQMRERWQQMREHRVGEIVDEVAAELGLDERAAGSLRTILSEYLELRSSRWQRMRDDDFDPATFQEEMRQARTAMEERVTGLVGASGLGVVEEHLQGRPF